jgi:uracil phosphoribosyltransferase
MKIHHLSEKNSVLNHFIGEIRDINIQKDRLRFRRNIERIGEIMAYEMSKEFQYKFCKISTPLGVKNSSKLNDKIVVCSILRAGLTLHNGFLNYFDGAENGFVSAYRFHPNNNFNFEIKVEYDAVSDINDSNLILVDPMLATGQSIVAVFEKLISKGAPKEIHLAVVIAAPEGRKYLETHLPDYCHLWIASIDEKLNEKNYIIPGLGDAGDLAFGSKL